MRPSLTMKTASLRRLTLLLLTASSCTPVTPPAGSDGGARDGAPTSAAPMLEVIVNGVHYGPSPATASSGARLVNTHDPQTGQVTSSAFSLTASSAEAGTSCGVSAQRSGLGVMPLGQGTYSFAVQSVRPNLNTVSPIDGEGESATVPQGSWRCTDAGCNGSSLAITRMDPSEVEGYITGTWPAASSSALAQVVCSFRVPLTTYVP